MSQSLTPAVRSAVEKALGLPNQQLRPIDLARVQRVAVQGATCADDLVALGLLPNLRELDLSFTRIRSLEGLQSVPELESLIIYGSRIDDLGPVSELGKLRSLDAKLTPIASVEPLAQLGLTCLDLSLAPLRSVAPLASCHALRELRLQGLGGVDLSPLEACRQLASLDLTGVTLDSIAFLLHCSALRHLSVYGARLGYVFDVGNIVQLESLNLAELDIDNVDWLSRLSELRYLNLNANPVEDLSSLRRLPLEELALVWTDVRLETLEGLPRLRSIQMDGESVQSQLPALEKLQGLRRIQVLDGDESPQLLDQIRALLPDCEVSAL